MQKILLTGGSGFVGRNLLEYFEKNHPGEFLIDAPRSRDLDVLDAAQVERWLSGNGDHTVLPRGERYDAVLHFAVYTDAVDKSKDGSKMYEYNRKSFRNFFDRRDLCGRLFYAGSGAEYDKSGEICSVSEEDLRTDHCPADPYGRMKYECGRDIEQSDNAYNLRIFGLFGQYEYPNRLITYLCRRSIEGQPFELNQDVYFDYLYIDDFCRMVYEILCAEHLSHHTYNMVSGKRISLLTLCDIVNRTAPKFGKPVQSVTVRNSGLNREYTASNRRILEEFPDLTPMPMEEAVEKLYRIYLREDRH